MGLNDTTAFWKVASVIQLIGLVGTVIGFSTPYLIHGTYPGFDDAYMGLWEFTGGPWTPYTYDPEQMLQDEHLYDDWLQYSRWLGSTALAMEIIGVALTLIALSTVFRQKCTAVLCIIMAFSSFALGAVSIIVFEVEAAKLFSVIVIPDNWTLDPAWGGYLFMIGQASFLVSGILHIFDVRRMNQE